MAMFHSFQARPYNEEEDLTEDEGAAVLKLPPKRKRAPRGPKPVATVVTAEPEPEEEEVGPGGGRHCDGEICY